MFMPDIRTTLFVVILTTAHSAVAETGTLGLGSEIPEQELPAILTAIPPTGEGLPAGQGRYEGGEKIFEERCASCHGANLEGTPAGNRLIGGRGSLASSKPVKTVESYWPYATSLFSYIRNTMPTTAPGTLSDSDTYAVLAYILGRAGVIDPGEVLSARSLPSIRMPNRDGFVADPRPDVFPGE